MWPFGQKRAPERQPSEASDAPLGPYLNALGGFWTDREGAPREADRLLAEGVIDADEHGALLQLIARGYAIIPGAVSDRLIESFLTDLEAVFDGRLPRRMSYWGADGGHHVEPATLDRMMENEAKLLDFHSVSAAAQDLIFAPKVLRFLQLVFREPPVAFQSLYFKRGSQQGIHQDTAFVHVAEAPLDFVASWIALEDVTPGSGELLYVPGSHRLPDILGSKGGKACPPDDPLLATYDARVREAYESAGMKPEPFLPKKGDVLFWAADLCHGGAAITRPGLTRHSMVTHYCPRGRKPAYAGQSEIEVKTTRAGGLVATQS